MAYEYIVPGAVGDLTEIESQTPDSGEHWDKLVLSDGDTTKVHTSQPEWQHDIYRITPDLPSGIERCPIASVRIYMTGMGTAPVNGSKGEHLIKTYGVVYPSGTVPTLGVSYSSYYKTWETNPHTGEAWTWSEIIDENFQIGVRIKASREYGVYESAITQVRIRIQYTPVLPAVTTPAVTEIVGTTATGNGILVDLGGEAPYQHGHCWSTSHNPNTSDSKTQNGFRATPGTFTSSITGLVIGTLYYCRAYATNSAGTSYGAEVEFTPVAPRLAISKAYALAREEL